MLRRVLGGVLGSGMTLRTPPNLGLNSRHASPVLLPGVGWTMGGYFLNILYQGTSTTPLTCIRIRT